jgi:hypothetical protein
MTNFEKWKDGLTLDSMAKTLSVGCSVCPLCRSDDTCSPADCGIFDECENAVREWGEQEVPH